MNKGYKILIILIFILSVNVSAFDASYDIVSKTDEKTGLIKSEIKVSGNLEGDENDIVTLTVKRPGADNKSSLTELYATIDQTFLKADKTFLFEIPFNEESGDYIINIYSENEEEPLILNMPYTSVEYINDFLGDLKNKKLTKEEIAEEISENGNSLTLDTEIYNLLKNDKKLNVAEKIMETEVVSFENMKEVFEDEVILNAFNLSDDTFLMVKALDKYKEKIGFNDKLSEEYFKKDKEEKEKILSYLKNKEIKSKTALLKEICDGIIFTEISSIEFYTEIDGIIENYKDYFNVDTIKKYERLSKSDKNKVAEYLSINLSKYKTKEDIEKALKYGINNLDKIAPDYSDNKGGGGSSGGGSSSVITIPDNLTKPDIKESMGNAFFSDITNVKWAEDAIKYLYDKGIVTGREYGKFYPDDFITRAEFIKILTEAFNIEKDVNESKFIDVTKDDWFYKYVTSGESIGIISGKEKDYFMPQAYITREEATAVIHRLLTYMNKNQKVTDTKIYIDEKDISPYAKNNVNVITAYKIVTGYQDNSFRPKNNITRAEASQIVYNTIVFAK